MEILTAIIDEFKIIKADPKLKDKMMLAKMLPFTDTRRRPTGSKEHCSETDSLVLDPIAFDSPTAFPSLSVGGPYFARDTPHADGRARSTTPHRPSHCSTQPILRAAASYRRKPASPRAWLAPVQPGAWRSVPPGARRPPSRPPAGGWAGRWAMRCCPETTALHPPRGRALPCRDAPSAAPPLDAAHRARRAASDRRSLRPRSRPGASLSLIQVADTGAPRPAAATARGRMGASWRFARLMPAASTGASSPHRDRGHADVGIRAENRLGARDA